MLTWHAGQVSQALTSLFPDIGLDPSRFSKVRGMRETKTKGEERGRGRRGETDHL